MGRHYAAVSDGFARVRGRICIYINPEIKIKFLLILDSTIVAIVAIVGPITNTNLISNLFSIRKQYSAL